MAGRKADESEKLAHSKSLRNRAELVAPRLDSPPELSHHDAIKLVHELQVHEIELTLQNEELQLARLELEQSVERYTELYEFAPVGYLTVDPTGVISAANLQMATMLGIERGRLVGRPLSRFAPNDTEKLSKLWRDIDTGASTAGWSTEVELVRLDGTTLWGLCKGVPIRGNTGEALGSRVAVSDITTRRQAQEALKKLNESLEQRVTDRTAQLRALVIELSQAERRERRRLAQVLHGNVQQMLVGAKLIVSSLARSNQTASELQLQYQKLQACLNEANATLRSLSVDLSPPMLFEMGLVPALQWAARRIEAQHCLTVIIDAEPRADDLANDARAMLFDAAQELLLNIVKHSGVKHARLRFRCISGSYASLTVEDDGLGFSSERLDEAARTDHFGLLTIRERYRGLGGNVEINSAPSAGTRVTLVLPSLGVAALQRAPNALVSGGQDAVEHDRSLMLSAIAAELPGGPKKIRVLLVDDHATVRSGLASVVNGEPDMQVVGEADSGEMAVGMAQVMRPDVIIMDISMPGMSGIEATRSITAVQGGINVIGLSMHEEPDIGRAMRVAGAKTYLSKTVPCSDLLAAIRSNASYVAPSSPTAPQQTS